ncbi:hypothetical protein [Pseudolactococcus piscium]|uniref:hypothetical protein n=1 Tax=Pseudolactococcus piscium TaxID=1364 RepID=UPI001FE3492E|nr:hypothetical protein [Lactococcus piscium]
MFDTTFFSMCLEALDTDLVYQLGLQLIEKNAFYRPLLYNAQIVKRTLVYVYMIFRGCFVYAEEFEKQLNTLLKPTDTDEKITIQIFKKILISRKEKNQNFYQELVEIFML